MKSRFSRGGGATYSRFQVGSSTTRLLVAVLRAPRILAALATLACAPLAQAADFYVAMPAPDGIGDDSNPGTSAAPFATIGAAITAAGGSAATIYIADGEYTLSAALTLAAPIVIIGNTTNPDQVIINNNSAQHLAFSITDASAAIKGVKITGTGTKGGNGGHISMTAGLLEDCIIFNGGGRAGNFKGGNVYMTGGRLRRCKIIDGKSTYNQYSGLGGNIYASGGVVENCLIKGGDGGHGSGIYADGAVKVVNCTFVGQKQTVTAGGEAVYANNSNARIVNCAIYGNGGTPQYEWGNKNASCFINCAVAASAASGFTGTGCTATLTAGDFVNYASGDYRPSASVNILEKGADPSSYASDLSMTDLGGQPRVSPEGGTIDIGCYEYQLAGVVLMGSISPKDHFQGDPVTCVASQLGASGSVLFKWDFDDGTPVVTSESSISYTYTRIGVHTNTLYLSEDGGATWCATNALETFVATVVPTNIYVKETNAGAAYPYDGNASAATNLAEACALACLAADQGRGTVCTIHVADGTYTLSAAIPLVNPTVVIGNTANPGAVILNNAGHLAFNLSHVDAALKGVKITGTGNQGGNGGHINMTAGLLEDCVVTNGGGRVAYFYGGNVYMTGGRIRRCVIADGKSTYTSSSGLGGNIYATGGVVENCLIKGGDGGRGSGIYVGGAVKVVNCTFVGQKQTVTDGGEAIYVNNSGARVVNCAFYGNGRTPKLEWGNQNASCFINCAVPPSAATGFTGTGCITTLTDGDFNGYMTGDYRPRAGGQLVDSGTDVSDYAISTTDLDGKVRTSGVIDVGCYEFDQSQPDFSVSGSGAPNGVDVVFTPMYGAAGGAMVRWNFDDGGAVVETTGGTAATHSFSQSKIHHVSLVASTDGGNTWSDPVVRDFVSAPANIWVDGSNANPAHPFATAATAATDLYTAIGMLTNTTSAGETVIDGVTIHVKPDTYAGAAYPALASAVAIVGEGGDRVAVTFTANAASRIFYLKHPQASLSGMTVDGGTTAKNQDGGCVYIGADGGIVSNCVVRNAIFTSGHLGANICMNDGLVADSVISGGRNNGNSGRGLNIYMTAGRVVRCKISGAIATRTNNAEDANGSYSISSAVEMQGGVLENCLLTDNKTHWGAIALIGASARALNCTVISNSAPCTTPKSCGIWANNANARAVNCAIYDNGGTALKEWGNSNAGSFTNCAFAADAAYSGTASTVLNLTDAAFKDYANCDFRPAKDGVLVNAGTKWDAYLGYGATSEKDLAGAARLSGKFLDIGCYETATSAGLQIVVR